MRSSCLLRGLVCSLRLSTRHSVLTAVPCVAARPLSQAAARPVVSVYDATTGTAGASVALPAVFTAPIRMDVVGFVHTNMAKNSRQAYAVSREAGHQTSAESWGTGRAVSRIPRVPGGGTHRAGQGAFGNMCRGGHMFNPTRVWRRWQRRVNVGQRRFATVSALAASAVPALVMARGHAVEDVVELPLVLDNLEASKTKHAVDILTRFGAYADVEKAKASRKIRAGKGKMRNRRYVQRRGPLVVYGADDNVEQAFRNLPGVELCSVERLNLLQLAPGGHVGRFIVWTKSAFDRLDSLYGTYSDASEKSGFSLPRPLMSNADLARVINSSEIQEKVKPAQQPAKYHARKKNPLKNLGTLIKLNPYAVVLRRSELRAQQQRATKRAAVVNKKRAAARRAASRGFYLSMLEDEHMTPAEALAAEAERKAAAAAQKAAEIAAKSSKGDGVTATFVEESDDE